MVRVLLCSLILTFGVTLTATAQSDSVLEYIRTTWETLTRSNADLLKAAVDPKHPPLPNGRWPVYVATQGEVLSAKKDLSAHMSPHDLAMIDVRPLPTDLNEIRNQGLLYLPNPYVVPGGRFNEMYGWDSYFILIGLLHDGKVQLAKDMVENFLYEIRSYGKILNANRTYYLTRSHPPFLTEMILGVYRKTKDDDWLRGTIPEIESYYRYWTSQPHLTPETGLSRYFDTGEGPAPEVQTGERDTQGRTIYDLARDYFRTHRVTAYDASRFYNRKTDRLTPLFYKGDRSMRESGFDPSGRFGPFSVDVIHYNPVCLNSLLYVMELQTAEILETLHRAHDAATWRKRAEERAQQINRFMWNSNDGLYYDYNLASKHVGRYKFVTTFFPLWAGISSAEQAARIVSNLHYFERDGGLQTSTTVSGEQWDAPFGWAPMQWIAVEGLRRYGYNQEADRISEKFLTMVAKDFRRTGHLEEKYDVVRSTSELVGEIRFGYHSNEAGFGWTNAVFACLLDQVPTSTRERILADANRSLTRGKGKHPRGR